MKLAVTKGDPRGIGPEIVAKALEHETRNEFVVVDGLETAHELAMDGEVRGIVTAPMAKRHGDGQRGAIGHTELLSEWCGITPPATLMMVSEQMKVALATAHVPISEVARVLTQDAILTAIRRTREALRRYWQIEEPRIAVMGLNPHAGEGGKIGDDEERTIIPALETARREGIVVDGPLSADSAFHFLSAGRWDAAVAMYHDQGLIPIKLGGFGKAVNISLGLPYIRTSVDHGTAYDIAGQGIADPSSMVAAIQLAKQLIRTR